MADTTWQLDFTGYVIGTIAICYGVFAKGYKRRPEASSRWIWVIFGIVAIIGNIVQNIFEF